jgi:hypothetical protein
MRSCVAICSTCSNVMHKTQMSPSHWARHNRWPFSHLHSTEFRYCSWTWNPAVLNARPSSVYHIAVFDQSWSVAGGTSRMNSFKTNVTRPRCREKRERWRGCEQVPIVLKFVSSPSIKCALIPALYRLHFSIQCPRIPETALLLEASRLRSFVLLVRGTCRWRVWIIGGRLR